MDGWGELPLEGQFFLKFVIVVAERIGFAAHPLALALFSDELSLLGHELSPEEDLVRPALDGESLEGAVVYAVKARGVGAFGLRAPYLERLRFRFSTPPQSSVPRTI